MLLEEGHEVVCLDNLSTGAIANINAAPWAEVWIDGDKAGVRRFGAMHLTPVMQAVTADPFPASYSVRVRQSAWRRGPSAMRLRRPCNRTRQAMATSRTTKSRPLSSRPS